MIDNPYQAPSAEILEEALAPFIPATRGRRLVAFLLDTLVVTLVWMLASELVALATGYRTPEPASSGDLARDLLGALATPVSAVDYMVGFVVWLLLQGALLHRRQQTLGKLVMGIRIVHAHGGRAGFLRIVLLRELPLWLVMLLPYGVLLAMLDPLAIFGRERRCLHDRVAGTRVAMAR
ncbi:RDD family protein [Pseudoxanthomonas japonensis]|uniref:RDD family protein n=1 Tax=Pseudoxanthomonas japonensis TaxID=69284 RepID=UPI001BCBA191|nr:RDD family protein [Pseudoxanthomonas japonensis]